MAGTSPLQGPAPSEAGPIGAGRSCPPLTRDPRPWARAGFDPRLNNAVVIGHDYPALLRARRRSAHWTEGEKRLYQRHRWRSEGFHEEAKTWHGLSRAVRRGLDNMKIQAYLTAAVVNLKRLAAALLAVLWAVCTTRTVARGLLRACLANTVRNLLVVAPAT